MFKTKIVILTLCLMLLFAGCAGDPIREELYIESVHLTGTEDLPQITLDANDLTEPSHMGAIEYDGVRFYLTSVEYRRPISKASDSIIESISVSDSIVETTVYTATIHPGTLVPYRVYRLWFFGHFSNVKKGDTITIRTKADGNTVGIVISSIDEKATDEPWHGWTVLTVRTNGIVGTISAHSDIALGIVETHTNVPSLVIDTTALNYVTITVEWSVADIDNTITLDQAYLEILN